jgi:hypothetical protein
MKKYLSSLPTKILLDQSVVMHVGSKSTVYCELLQLGQKMEI